MVQCGQPEVGVFSCQDFFVHNKLVITEVLLVWVLMSMVFVVVRTLRVVLGQNV